MLLVSECATNDPKLQKIIIIVGLKQESTKLQTLH